MRPFAYQRAETPNAALAAFGRARGADAIASPVQYLAGGTTLIDLMKLDVMRPEALVDINALERTPLGEIDADRNGVRLGAMARMADAAAHPIVKRDVPGPGRAVDAPLALSQDPRPPVL